MCNDRCRPSPRRSPARRLPAAACWLFLFSAACEEFRAPAVVEKPVAEAAPETSRRNLVVIQPRGAVRVPFQVRVSARMETEEMCEVVLDLQSPHGGPAEVEFSLPERVVAVEGETLRRPELGPHEARRERLVVQVPPVGYFLLGAGVTIDGRRSEAFVRFGEPPTAEEKGFRTRPGSGGGRVLRLGPEDFGNR